MRLLPPQAMPLLQALWRHKWLGRRDGLARLHRRMDRRGDGADEI